MSNVEIVQNSSIKDLGIIISNDLSWSPHHRLIIAKAYESLGLIRRTFTTNLIEAKRQLYLSLVQSQVMYCLQIWRPYLVQDIILFEKIQRQATKYLLNNYISCYRSRFIKLSLLPLMYIFELNDIIFLISSLKQSSPHFQITDYIFFNTGSTRSSSYNRLIHTRSNPNSNRHFYFNRLPRLWNSTTNQPFTSLEKNLIKYMWSNFMHTFDPHNPCTFHLLCPCSRCSQKPTTPCYNF